MDIISLRRANLRQAIDAKLKSEGFSSDAAFCEHYDLNPSHISQLVKGHGSFGERAARNLEKKVGWEAGYLDRDMPDTRSEVVAPVSNVRPSRRKLRKIPVLDFVQAGIWREVVYDGVHPKDETYTTYEGKDPNAVFSLEIDGLSMAPEFMPGDEIVVDAALDPKPGSLVVAQEIQHGVAMTTFKKYRVVGVNEHGVDIIELVPLNPDFPTYNSSQIEISIIGVVVQHHKDFKY
ncbi:peptidase [Acinetobacter sp. LoGeW2-3]|uniref:LexA family protein n=1 Tax=Acinetobacter sp. LoGeW2-3 TaxID=1808001 RepID=UPI000C058E72|nr:S24 family peptidase [Acinetobacter sp. LoGeW2-3]ATO20644.1 peptidase [Acinetobacter sp. LoGeW2-3]